jgi:hypothetical protein
MANPSRKEMIQELVKIRGDKIYNRNIERIDEEITLLKEEMMKASDEELEEKETKLWVDYEGQIPARKERIDNICCYAHDDKVNDLYPVGRDEKYEEELNEMEPADLLILWQTTKNNVVPPTYTSIFWGN